MFACSGVSICVLLSVYNNNKNYDKSARLLPPLQPGQAVKIHSEKGYDKPGTVVRKHNYPRSYVVEYKSTEYRRNRRHLSAVPKPHAEEGIPVILPPEHGMVTRSHAAVPTLLCLQSL